MIADPETLQRRMALADAKRRWDYLDEQCDFEVITIRSTIDLLTTKSTVDLDVDRAKAACDRLFGYVHEMRDLVKRIEALETALGIRS